MNMKHILTLPVILLLVGCGTTLATQSVTKEEMNAEAVKQRQFALMERHMQMQRVKDVGYKVLKDAISLCEERRYSYGVDLWSIDSFANDFKEAAKLEHGLNDNVQVRHAYADFPMAKAGLKQGDQIIKINDYIVEDGKKGAAAAYELIAKLETSEEKQDLSVVYARGDQVKTANIKPVQICGYPVYFDPANTVNAYADGQKIVMFKGMADFTRTDDEIALIMGHELAHNVLNHIEKKKAQMTAGILGGLLLDVLVAASGANSGGEFANQGAQIGANAYSPAYESEADYMGLYATALAGYDIVKAPYLWRRMGANNTGAITITSTHPPTAERFVALEKTVAEVQAKIANNQPLVPEKKADQ